MPIIDVRRSRKGNTRGHMREGRACEAYPVETAKGTRYRCDRRPWDPKCPAFETCPLLPVFVDSALNPPHLAEPYERWIPFPFGSTEWRALYRQRSSVERVFSRLKGAAEPESRAGAGARQGHRALLPSRYFAQHTVGASRALGRMGRESAIPVLTQSGEGGSE